MKIKLMLGLMLLSGTAQAAFVGKLDLANGYDPVAIRELHDGQWLAGIAKDNIWHLDQISDDGTAKQRIHAGLFVAWNAEHGNPAYGPLFGIDLPVGLANSLAGLAPDWKAAAYFKSAVTLDLFGGYRPTHTPDTHDWIYGVGAKLSVSFGSSDLQKGL